MTCRAVTSLALACTLAALGGVQREFPLGVSFRMTFGIAAEKSPRFTVRAEEMRDRSVETNSAGAVVMRWCGHAKALILGSASVSPWQTIALTPSKLSCV